jgi:predicted dinucleotide-binding enzyme
MKTIGLIGAGHIGSQLARLSVANGYDVVIGSLTESWRIQPGTPGYGPRRNALELRRDLDAAQRPARS